MLEFAREHDDVRPNPAALSGWLKNKLGDARSLGKVDRKTGEGVERGNHPAMPYRDVPAFMAQLKATPGETAAALRFLILTAARSSEVFGMTGDEVDPDAKFWVVPKERMKMGVEHVVPLSDAAVEILRGHSRRAARARSYSRLGARARASSATWRRRRRCGA